MRANLSSAVREPHGAAPEAPTLVLLHGLGSSEADLMAFAPMLPPMLRVIAYRAPHSYTVGSAWFDIGWSSGAISMDESQARATSIFSWMPWSGWGLRFDLAASCSADSARER